MPINYKDYPKNWKTEIRPRILARAQNKCEFCGVKNYSKRWNGKKMIKIILTVAHLDHDRHNFDVSDNRLRALCQKCHLNYDKNGMQNRLFDICNMKGCDKTHHAKGLCNMHYMRLLRKSLPEPNRERVAP